MALQLPPPAGFKHPLLRYPVGCGFTQRVGYPFSAAPAQIWTNLPQPIPNDRSEAAATAAARVPYSGAAHSGGAADVVYNDTGLRTWSQMGGRGPGTLPQIAEEPSEDDWHDTELGGWGASSGYDGGQVPSRQAAAAVATASGAQHAVDCVAPSTAAAPCALECAEPSGLGSADENVAEGQEVDGCMEGELQVAGGSSLAGPAPLDAHAVSLPCRDALRPAAVPRAAAEAADVDVAYQQRFTAVVIPQRGAHGPVLARVAGRSDLLYSAVDEEDGAAAAAGFLHHGARGTQPQARGGRDSHGKDDAANYEHGKMDIDMFTWINDREIVRKDIGGWSGVAASQGDSDGGEAPGDRCGPMVGAAGGGEHAPCIMDSWVDGLPGAALPLVSAACSNAEEVQQWRMRQAQTLPRLEPLHMDDHRGGGSGVALRLSPVNRMVSPNRPRLSDAAVLPPTGKLPPQADSACGPPLTALGLHARMARQQE